MSKLRIAIVGAGHLGHIHAQLAQQLPDVELTAVVDPVASVREQVAAEVGARPAATLEEIVQDVDAAIVAAPTSVHYTIGKTLLTHGIHVLMEKPMTRTSRESDQLVQLAKEQQCVLQVGHVERFNPAFRNAEPHVSEPKYIEARRLGNFTFRSMDIGVVLDLMVHDLDIILRLVNSSVHSVLALGTAVLTDHEDMAQARLEFENGCVANLTASRVAMKSERIMSVYGPESCAHLDFGTRTTQIIEPSCEIQQRMVNLESIAISDRSLQGPNFQPLFSQKTLEPGEVNPLLDEQRDFVHAIRTHSSPIVSGQAGSNAVQIAERICDAIEQHQWNGSALGPIGPHAMPGPTILPAAVFADNQRQRRKAG